MTWVGDRAALPPFYYSLKSGGLVYRHTLACSHISPPFSSAWPAESSLASPAPEGDVATIGKKLKAMVSALEAHASKEEKKGKGVLVPKSGSLVTVLSQVRVVQRCRRHGWIRAEAEGRESRREPFSSQDADLTADGVTRAWWNRR